MFTRFGSVSNTNEEILQSDYMCWCALAPALKQVWHCSSATISQVSESKASTYVHLCSPLFYIFVFPSSFSLPFLSPPLMPLMLTPAHPSTSFSHFPPPHSVFPSLLSLSITFFISPPLPTHPTTPLPLSSFNHPHFPPLIIGFWPTEGVRLCLQTTLLNYKVPTEHTLGIIV